MKTAFIAASAAVLLPAPALAQVAPDAVAPAASQIVAPTPTPALATLLPANTLISVTPVQEITSKDMKEGDVRMLQVATDVSEKGVIVIPRGAPVQALVTWRTGKGIVGKSAKFELTFQKITVGGKDYALKGTHRQEGRGNTVGALLGSMIITGRSAVMPSGQIVNAFTAEAIPAP